MDEVIETTDLVRQLVRELRRVFGEGAGESSSFPPAREVESILQSMIMFCRPNECAREKITIIRKYAGVIFSTRKRGSIPGRPRGAKITVLGDIELLESALRQGLGH